MRTADLPFTNQECHPLEWAVWKENKLSKGISPFPTNGQTK
jgi:hypothetical protein